MGVLIWQIGRFPLARNSRKLLKCFDSLIILTLWMIWNERNRRTSDNVVKTVEELLAAIGEEVASWVFAGSKQLISFSSASFGSSPG